MGHDRIAIVDFGGQYAHLIANKFRRMHVLAEIRQPDDPAKAFDECSGIVLSGSPLSLSKGDRCLNQEIMDMGVPILGLCFGHQEIARYYGGTVQHTAREYGPARFQTSKKSDLLHGIPESSTVWMSHGDSVTSVPDLFEEIGVSIGSDGAVHRNAAIASDELRRYGLQFHPEVDDTENGDAILSNFAVRICRCRPSWTTADFIDDQVGKIANLVGSKSVLLLVSGGIDSTVCAKLMRMALDPCQLHLLHIDNGLMRKNESIGVIEEMKMLGLQENLHFVDASSDFLAAVAGLVDPEQKRKAIGDMFISIFEHEVDKIGIEDVMLGQGTIYPDTIESGGTKRSDVIKTHHNRVPIVERMIAEGRVVEPIRELYKAEVREVAELLGIADRVIYRHPFPGPGLGVRCLCSDGFEPPAGRQLSMQLAVDEQLSGTSLRGAVLPMKSVGVKGDLRSYEQPVVIWGSQLNPSVLQTASRICSRIPGANRCFFDLTGKGVKSANAIRATLTSERVEFLREVDDIVTGILDKHGVLDVVWQCPIAIVPMEINGRGRELVVIRPVLSERAMTARPAVLSPDSLEEIGQDLSLPEVSGIVLDLTTKPPGCIELE